MLRPKSLQPAQPVPPLDINFKTINNRLVVTEARLSVLLISLTGILTYGVWLPWLGYYWDDWLMLWVGQAQGPDQLAYQMSWDRPFHGILYGLTHPLFHDHVLLWQLYTFSLYLLSALVLLWMLRLVWPTHRFGTTATTLLYIVYPGFMGHAFAYCFQGFYVVLLIAFLSIGFSLKAQKAESNRAFVLYTCVAMTSGLIYLFIFELFISLEIIRLLFIIYVVLQEKPQPWLDHAINIFKRSFPYLLIASLFLFWRFFLFDTLRPETNVQNIISRYQAVYLPSHAISLTGDLVSDFLETTLFAWFVPAWARATVATAHTVLISFAFGCATASLTLLYYWQSRQTAYPTTLSAEKHIVGWARILVIIGVVATTLALLPAQIAFMNLKLLSIDERFTMYAVLPTVMLVVGVVFMSASQRARPWIIAGLVAFSVMTQFNNANYFRGVWSEQLDFWWQMTWRIPDIAPQTTLVISTPDTSFFPSDTYEIWAPANIIYAPDADEPEIYGTRLSERVAQIIHTGRTLEYSVMRDINFEMNFDNALVISAPYNGTCLRVVDGSRVELPHHAPSRLHWVAGISRLSAVQVSAAQPSLPSNIFGEEPRHTWCYYFEKAELALQLGDMEQITHLGDEARQRGLKPQEASEWLPFIKGYTAIGRCDEAKALVATMRDTVNNMDEQLLLADCTV